MRTAALLLLGGLLAFAGCGDDDDSAASSSAPAARQDAATQDRPSSEPPAQTRDTSAAAGTRIVVRGSEFGSMLWGPKRQAIYIFQRDSAGRSRCYGACAEAWPPVLTKGRPAAGRGVRESLLGTTRRRDGTRQVTYGGKPLYYYAHEGPGQVLCHNVDLNGGLWWVVGPGGERRP